jgi:hypothetical protein
MTSVGASASAAGGGGAAKHVSAIDFHSQRIAVTTSTGKKLSLAITGAQFTSTSTSDSPGAISVSLRTPNRRESHVWTFQLSDGSFSDSPMTGKGTISTGPMQIAPYGQISLHLKAIGSASVQHCPVVTKVVRRRLSVAGTVSFDTHAAAWGSVGGIHHHFRFGTHGGIRTQYGGGNCLSGAPPKCDTGVQWFASSGDTITADGGWSTVHGHRRGHLEMQRLVLMNTPDEANRSDTVRVSAPAPALSVHAGLPTLVVDTSGHGATGSAQRKCSKTHHEKVTNWDTAALSNGDHALTLHEQIEGPLTVANTATDGSITKSTQTN